MPSPDLLSPAFYGDIEAMHAALGELRREGGLTYTFDIRRSPNPHVAFGFGTHFCLGASLARLQLRLVLRALTRAIKDLTVLEGPDIEPNVFVGAVRFCRFGFRRR